MKLSTPVLVGLIGAGAGALFVVARLTGWWDRIVFVYTGWNENQVRGWIDQALAALEADGVSTSALNPDDLVLIAKHESNGDPGVTQKIKDVNSAAGDPAKGIMQTITRTFEAYKSASLPSDIFNPIANIAASGRYILHRYGSSANVPGVIAVNGGFPYVGY